jgi:hypothetical protein
VQQAARLLARLGAAPIPLAILEALGPELSSPRVRATLRARSLLTEAAEPPDGVVLLGRMHRVLADFLRARAPDPAGEWLRACEVVVAVMDPDRCRDPGSWPLMDPCLAHAEELFKGANGTVAPGSDSAAVELGLRMGILLTAQGLFPRAAEVAPHS